MNFELLNAHQRHTKTIIDFLYEIKEVDYNCITFLDVVRDGLNHIVSEIQPNNELAKALIQDSSTIGCHIAQSEFLINAASAVFNIINAEFDAVSTEKTEASVP
ncbi:MAG: hypothetical protein HC815_36070 [Richelia sp. RM1_1_1]|nr:hypothetical protein [Richelia sp. RM1_1_1]